jgi:MFS family permease
VLWAGTLGAGVSLAAVFPTALALAGRHMPVRGSVNAWFFAGASVGSMGLPWLIGQLFERVGPRVTFALVAADLAASLAALGLIVLRLRRTAREKSSPDAGHRSGDGRI